MAGTTHSWVVNEHSDGTANGWCSCGWSSSGDKDTVNREANNTASH